jgi:hypothetical protein
MATVSAPDVDACVVASEPDVRRMVAELLSGDRVQPAVGITSMPDSDELVLTAAGVLEVVGPSARIYLVTGEDALRGVDECLGRGLALLPGAVRVWWSGLTLGSDPADHPLVTRIDDEDDAGMLAEFRRRFDLSRPTVRREIRELEDLRALLERELTHERRENQNLKVEFRQMRTRAEAAEASLMSERSSRSG